MNSVDSYADALQAVTAGGPSSAVDPLELVNEAMLRHDQDALKLLRAGVELHIRALKERQQEGIKKAQKVKSKYPGRTPGVFKMGGKKLDLLHTVLKNKLRQLQDAVEDGRTAEVPELSMAGVAKQLRISRSTLYRYIKMAPNVAKTAALLKKAEGQRKRDSLDKEASSLRKAHHSFEEGLKAANLKRSDRPIQKAEADRKRAFKVSARTKPGGA